MDGEAIPHREDWHEHYPTGIAYGYTYPAAEDWVFGDFGYDSVVLLNQIRTVDIAARIIEVFGSLDTKTMTEIDHAIQVSLGVDR